MSRLTTWRIRMQFHSPLHLSQSIRQPEQTREYIAADTLSAAVMACAFQLGQPPETVMESFQGIRLSSAFPYFQETHFFPKPFCRMPPIQNMENDPAAGKKLKKIQYLSQPVFEQILNGSVQYLDADLISDNGKYVGIRELQSSKKYLHERVLIDLEDGYETTPFVMQNIVFHPEGGLHFLLNTTEDVIPDWFTAALHLLSDNGIGADRNVGYGKFQVSDPEKIHISAPSQAEHVVSIAPVFPDEHIQNILQLAEPNTAWKLKLSEGYISSPGDVALIGKQRQPYMQLMEGAVLTSPQTPCGRIRDVRPENIESHPVWRDGRGFWLPIKPL
jgi:CRISPR-associated protein Csm4